MGSVLFTDITVRFSLPASGRPTTRPRGMEQANLETEGTMLNHWNHRAFAAFDLNRLTAMIDNNVDDHPDV